MDEHPNADAAHVEAVEEVLCAVLQRHVLLAAALLHLKHSLSHRFYHVAMAITNDVQGLNKSVNSVCWKIWFDLDYEEVEVRLEMYAPPLDL